MLKLGPVEFTSGRSSFIDSLKEIPEPSAKVFVRIRLEGQTDSSFYAQLDTGAAWSVLDPVLARKLGWTGLEGPRTQVSTRFGLLKGTLVPLRVTFLAGEGEDLEISGTFFVSPDWPPGRTFLGYSGLLDSIRFALDPQKNHFYFGPGT